MYPLPEQSILPWDDFLTNWSILLQSYCSQETSRLCHCHERVERLLKGEEKMMPTCCKTFPSLLLSVSNIQGAAEDSSQYHKILLLDLQRTSSSQIVWRNNKNKTRKNKFFPISCEASCEDLFEFNYLKRDGTGTTDQCLIISSPFRQDLIWYS